MRQHNPALPVLALLRRLGWQRDPDSWTVRCREDGSRRAVLRVGVSQAGVTIAGRASGTWDLDPLEAGRLRAALRDALLTYDRIAAGEPANGADRAAR